MALSVTDKFENEHTFPTATTWHIDDDGDLHLSARDRADNRDNPATPVASFAPGTWIVVAAIREPSAGPFSPDQRRTRG